MQVVREMYMISLLFVHFMHFMKRIKENDAVRLVQ
jgi:hypothetical protein